MNRREFLVSASASVIAATVSGLPDLAVAQSSQNDVDSVALDYIQGSGKRLITAMGSADVRKLAPYVAEFNRVTTRRSAFPTFSIGDEHFTDCIKSRIPAPSGYLIAFVKDISEYSLSNQGESYLASAMRYNPDLILFEHLTGPRRPISKASLNSIYPSGNRVAGGVHAANEEAFFASLFRDIGRVPEQFDNLVLADGGPRVQTFYEGRDVTHRYVAYVKSHTPYGPSV